MASNDGWQVNKIVTVSISLMTTSTSVFLAAVVEIVITVY